MSLHGARTNTNTSDGTLILSKIEASDPEAARELLPLVYEELRKQAETRSIQEGPDHTLQATALLREAYMPRHLLYTALIVHPL
ncbi:MAG: hypothetical protein KDB03_25015 [Planctomycetales bacterium]|nr:hypothetical protein [Planctomycetales bacterium]